MPMSIRRMVPIEVDMNVLVLGETVIPVHLGEMPVNQALDIVATRLDPEIWNILGHLDLGVE
jgi:hypothetical protein